MKNTILPLLLCVAFQFAKAQTPAPKKSVIIVVQNPVSVQRNNETITLTATLIKKAFPHTELQFIQVKEIKSNTILPSQSIDYNADGILDEIVFQTNLTAHEKKKFELTPITENPKSPARVYAKHLSIIEGMDDFTWENDLIGYRFYGQERANKQGTGIAMDVWCKRLPDFLTDKWYAPGQSYHKDTGYGADHYNSGKNQGCGGTGLLKNDSIYFPKPYSNYKIIANGPIRVVFELQFTAWEFDKTIVETKRITLDAGQYFNKIESRYNQDVSTLGYLHAINFVQRDDSQTTIKKDLGYSFSWESLGDGKGNLGTGFMAQPKDIVAIKIKNKQLVSTMQPKLGNAVTYYTAAAWDQFGSIHSPKNWEEYIANKANCIKNPCIIVLKKVVSTKTNHNKLN
ncbi:DUF4861 family protein [Flavobacterium muglaense]|uniref:DUF4861 family protein n=1 Tax=Flavobacterium muglaense TaxID=2764716 RepID=A0A923MYY9_9FLAO|nr:DUF4861 family protein [Flavobacterium muglaense]MBC5837495.1 DUF4861 family protein [Flavobacterium muglaense]MBC5844022.1 DUF4861 family protein [Flavobacterium muglaense]